MGKNTVCIEVSTIPGFKNPLGFLKCIISPTEKEGLMHSFSPTAATQEQKATQELQAYLICKKKPKNKKQSQDAECWWLTVFYLEKMQTKIKSTLKPKKGGNFCVCSTNPSGS